MTSRSVDIFKVVWVNYLRSLNERPVLTKSLTSGTLALLGDLIAQFIEHFRNSKPFALQRALQFASFGIVISGPIFHLWYKLLEKLFQGQQPTLKVVLMKMVVSMLFMRPLFLFVFFTYMPAIQGQTVEEIKKKIKNDLVPAWIASTIVWIPASFVSYKYVRSDLRVLYDSCIALVWNVYFRIKNK